MPEQELHNVLDLRKSITSAQKRAWRDIVGGYRWKAFFLIDIFLIVWVYLGPSAAILWTAFSAFLFYSWDNRILGTIAILFLISCPVLLSLQQDGWAEQMAVYAYYFLVMTVVLQIIEYKREGKSSPDPADLPRKRILIQ